ncbi:MAG: PAS domain-containing sensor histidine kinase [Alphaproteobacteria bacterium]|nr:PAS domain-containing sensor histidine kinase [Alphaproteobacteria bacterium]
MKFSQAYSKLRDWALRHHLGRKLLFICVLGSIISVVITSIMLKNTPNLSMSRNLLTFLLIDFVFLMIFIAVIAKSVASLWAERKSDQAGSMLHSRIVAIFSLLAIVPTILVAGCSVLFFNIGIQSWFNQRVETAINESKTVSEAYLQEHQNVVSANAQAMAAELMPLVRTYEHDSLVLNSKLTDQTEIRSLDEAIIFNENMAVLGRSRFSYSLDFEKIPASDLSKASTSPVLHADKESSRVRALVAIDPITSTYLLVGRRVSPIVLSRVENSSKAALEYKRLQREGSSYAFKLAGIFVGIAILLLLAAVLGGLLFANKLAGPIRRLIQVSEEVCKGNLSVRIKAGEETPELSSLTSAFNRMTSQLESQRDELMIANEQIDERRQFTEAVLSGVSAGVIGLDAKGAIQLSNESASSLLGLDLRKSIGRSIKEIIPEMAFLLQEIKTTTSEFVEKHITINQGGHGYTFIVRLSANQMGKKLTGYVITFDDITQLQIAQRKAAWAEMARRIAHEIKNPLTPIQLSAERLKRRYTNQITQDPDTFNNCVDTIIRQVGHIGEMVGEFSSFARMPAPDIKPENLIQICKEEIFLQQQAHGNIKIDFISPLKSFSFPCDRGQMGQVLTNLLQNAVQAIETKQNANGHIQVNLEKEGKKVTLTVSDNGVGLPPEGRERLTEPYITYREKGTGLGLAIVKKIVEDHGGSLIFKDSPEGGALVQVLFTRSPT